MTDGPQDDLDDEVDLVVVTLRFRAADPEALAAVLAKYVVVARGAEGCRNIDLCASATDPAVLLVVQKWASPAAQRAHFDSPEMVDMAQACTGLLAEPPQIDLFDPISAHDLA
jgi:quinol monooxygenase YgiN